mmetsp:Transcript_19212/g.41506  ORF Transcript_19212/g.41506 Transcript_19212/m.41506 type:complete len:265 (+) Transcript_19212:160-954(+)
MMTANGASSSATDGTQRLVVMRHGRRLDSVHPQWQLTASAPWDSPLAPGSLAECSSKAAQLKGLNFKVVAISPFTRCLQTAAALLSHIKLDPSCKIVIHRGLSEVHCYEFMFLGRGPSLCQRLALWRWRRSRDSPPPEFARMGSPIPGLPLQPSTLGSWPPLPETPQQARQRYEATLQELLGLAAGGDVLLVSHAECVQHSVLRVSPGAAVNVISFLGHTTSTRPAPSAPGTSPRWQLQPWVPEHGVEWYEQARSTTAGAVPPS